MLPADLLDSAPCGFVSFGDDGRIDVVNATLLERLGYQHAELHDKHVETILARGAGLFYQTHFFPLVRMQGRAQEIFLMLRAKSGEELGVLCNAVLRTRNERTVIDCILIEVNERRKYEDALLEAKRRAERANHRLEEQAVELELQQYQLQEQATELELQADELERQREIAESANRAKSDFLATMSHELRTPLNAIGGYALLMKEGVYGQLPPAQLEALDRLLRSQRHLLALINDVLNLAKIETGRLEFSLDDVAVEGVIAELSSMIEPQMAAKSLTYRVEIPDAPLMVRADRDKLTQVVLNLLSNAVKFTGSGGQITVRASADAGTVATARIEVIDNGRGIPKDKLEDVFEPFVQVRADPARPNDGTGLGLAISRNLARGMGGDLSASSEVGKGSCFTLTLQRAS